MDNSIKTSILQQIKKSGNIRQICKSLKIHHSKFYRECDTDPVFGARVRQAKAEFILKLPAKMS